MDPIKLSRHCSGALLAFFCAISLAEIRVTDDLGREIILPSPARRIISLAPHNTENLFTAGAGDYIVGTVDHSDFPKQALDIPRIGGYNKINIEAVLATKPDLAIAWSSGNQGAVVQRLIDFGVPVFYSEANTFEKIMSNIESFSQIADTQVQAAPKIKKMRAILASLEQQYAEQPPVSVFYQVWDKPLITLNGQHAVSQAFKICGATNVFADEPTIAPRVGVEGVIASNPQLILLAGHNKEQTIGWKQEWVRWPGIDAVRNNAISYINPDIVSRPTQRFIAGIPLICEIIELTRKNLGMSK